MPSLDDCVNEKIAERKAKNEARTLSVTDRRDFPFVIRNGKRLISFACNDYLGLSNHPEVIAAARDAAARYGAGAGASRLIGGNHPLYAELEHALAAWKGMQAALVFGSGYMANLGIISALVEEGDLILADKLAHACMIDGARLSGAKLLRFAHNDPNHAADLLEKHRGTYRNCLMLTESVFSMDGDLGAIEELSALANRHDAWLLVDDAHGLGLLNEGKGGSNSKGIELSMGTLSKALGSYGGYVCASRAVIDYLISASRPQIFTTGLPPAAIGAALASLAVIRREPERGEMALARARQFTDTLGMRSADSAIIPVMVGEAAKALEASRALEEQGIWAPAIRPPTVPPGTARLRFSFSAVHTEDQVQQAAMLAKTIIQK